MNEMVERAARAMAWEAIIESLELSGVMAFNPEWTEKQVDEDWPMYRRHARAAIAAMREPTEEMIDDGDDEFPQFEEAMYRFEYLRKAWQAMIDAALPPQGEGNDK